MPQAGEGRGRAERGTVNQLDEIDPFSIFHHHTLLVYLIVVTHLFPRLESELLVGRNCVDLTLEMH